jgi:hypothetical protein
VSDDTKERQKGRGANWRDYIPLITIVSVTILAACAKQANHGSGWHWMTWMHDFIDTLPDNPMLLGVLPGRFFDVQVFRPRGIRGRISNV